MYQMMNSATALMASVSVISFHSLGVSGLPVMSPSLEETRID